MAFHFTDTSAMRPTIPGHRPAVRELFDNIYGTWASISPDERNTFIDWLTGTHNGDKANDANVADAAAASAESDPNADPSINGDDAADALVNGDKLTWYDLSMEPTNE